MDVVKFSAAVQADTDERLGAGNLPPEAPIHMPVQSLSDAPVRPPRPAATPRFIFLRRLFVIGGALLITALGAAEMYRVLNVAGLTVLEAVVLALFVALFAWIALSFVSAIVGFISLVGRGGAALGTDPRKPLPELATRTAILMPTYNENPARIIGGLEAIYESLEALGALEHFDFFILSDTTDPDLWVAEEASFLAFRQRTGGEARIFYRRRPHNTERKAGNIADWVRRFGGRYQQMLVLDADSVMSGDTIVRIVAAMERNPGVGLIQTLPIIVNGTTLFARLQQFAGRLYGPVIAHGIAWWHGADSNYWGHNAVIRTKAFAEQAGLPHLPGRKPFGGHVLSHDFVEAALIRRGGWAVHMVPRLAGSYEEGPPTMADFAVRDRRWCQGNLQHIKILPARGLHWMSRLHLLVGIAAYVTAPVWLLFLIVGGLISLQARFIPPSYFTAEFSLFPQWPAQDPERAVWVFAGTMVALLAPKIMGYIAMLFDRETRRGCGGGVRAFLSVLVETVIAGLIAPFAMLIQSVGIISILCGRDVGWSPQRRDDGSIAFGEMFRRYWPHTAFGLAFGAGAYAVSLSLFLWMSPVILGLVLAIPLASLTASRRLGQTTRWLGLLRTPEETDPPAILARARELTCRAGEALAVMPHDVRGLLGDPDLLEAHRRMLPARRHRRSRSLDVDLLVGFAKLEESHSLDDLLERLSPREAAAVLGDPRCLDHLVELARMSEEPAAAVPLSRAGG